MLFRSALSPLELWYVALRRQVERLGLAGEIDTNNLTVGLTKPPLGFFPTLGQVREHKVSQGHYSEGESLSVMHGIDWLDSRSSDQIDDVTAEMNSSNVNFQ